MRNTRMKSTMCACMCLLLACLMSSVHAQDPTEAAEPEASAVTLDRQISSPTSVSIAPPTTYLVYFTVNGVQTSRFETFTASTPVPTTTISPLPGTVLEYSSYLPPSSSSSSTGGASHGPAKFSRTNGQVAAMGVLLSMLVGAVAVW